MEYGLKSDKSKNECVNSKSKNNSPLLFWTVAYFLVSTIMPVVSGVSSAYIYMLSVFLLYLIVFYKSDRVLLFIIPFLGLSILKLLSVYYRSSESIPLSVYRELLLFVPPMLCFYLLCKNKRSLLKYFIVITIVSYVITAVTSYVGLWTDPSASRNLAAISDSKDAYLQSLNMKNIGGYETVYSIVLMFPMIICLFKEKVINIATMAFISVTFALFVISAQYTTAILMFSISSFLLFNLRKFTGKSAKWIIIAAIVSVFILKPFFGLVFHELADITASQSVADRLGVISDSFYGIKSTSDAVGRFNRYAFSIDKFAEHPIIGNWLFAGPFAGGHSVILDTLAQFGLFGIAALFLMYRQMFRKLYLPFRNTNYYGYMLYTFFQTILLSSINSGQFFLVIAFITPAIGYLLQEKNYKSVKRGAILYEDNVDN